jgi:glycosyltransferase involved in cell wall biosynthesis
MQALHCCVIVPTYNNAKTLPKVLNGILDLTSNVIVVNDGATDDTLTILEGYPQITQVHLSKNKGKGNALQVGFKTALENNYEFAITIDSDGQHFPEDISIFLDGLEKEPTKNVLYIGARNMAQSDVPGKSNFGNKFSNFWFWFETGNSLTDTQCGYRLYPLKEIEKLKLYTPKFEFEIEVIVKAAWNGTLVKNVPVKISYDDKERVSHFRTVPDFTRISVLNTWFVLVTIFYIKPRDFYRRIKKKGIKKFLLEDILGSTDSPSKKAISIALGVFVGLSPFWGLHTLLVLFLAFLFKLNKPIAFAFSNISLPPLIPFIILFSLHIGNWVLGENLSFALENITSNFDFLTNLKTYVVGSLLLAISGALLFGGIGYLTLTFLGKRKMAVNNG